MQLFHIIFLIGGLETGERRCGGGGGDDYKARVRGVHGIEKQREKNRFRAAIPREKCMLSEYSSMYLNVVQQQHP